MNIIEGKRMSNDETRQSKAFGRVGKQLDRNLGPGGTFARREFLTSAVALGVTLAGGRAGNARGAMAGKAPHAGINVPRTAGQYYKTTIPDTLDLAERRIQASPTS